MSYKHKKAVELAVVPAQQKNFIAVSQKKPSGQLDFSLPLPVRSSNELWLAMTFPQLSLDVFEYAQDQALAIVSNSGRQEKIFLANGLAQKAGVRQGLTVASAFALCPSLQIKERDLSKEKTLIEQVAVWAFAFSSRICLLEENALLLEIKSSLKLFGGLDAFKKCFIESLDSCAASSDYAIAPTSLAALWLARGKPGAVVTSEANIHAELAQLPLAVTGWSADILAHLSKIGVHHLQACWRLPRDGISKRFGKACLQQLDQALAKANAIHHTYKYIEPLKSKIFLDYETDNLNQVIHYATTMLQPLAQRLEHMQRGISLLRWSFYYHHAETTHCMVDLGQPSRNLEQLLRVVIEVFSSIKLKAAIHSLSYCSDKPQLAAGSSGGLFGAATQQRQSFSELLTCLKARLGQEAVFSVRPVNDYRPDKACLMVEPSIAPVKYPKLRRPLWLLNEPLFIAEHSVEKTGITVSSSQPERIEGGWWDGFDIRRDYYHAHNNHSQQLWLYQDKKRASHWYLHGLFA